MSTSNNMASAAATTRTATPTREGSRTVEARPQPVLRNSAPSGVLRLRAEPTERRHIQWAEDVIDNEGMGKKSSKVCCIYHAPREAGESSDDSSDSSSDEDSDSEPDNSTARPTGRLGNQRGRRPHEHDHGDCEHDHDHDNGEGSGNPKKRSRPRRKPSPNAYEKMPKNKKQA